MPFAVEASSDSLLKAINIIKDLDQGKLKKIPEDAPTAFMPRELRRIYKNKEGGIKRNVWELGLAIAMKDALRSGDLYLPMSKQHVYFWELILDDTNWKNTRENSYQDLEQPYQSEVKSTLILQFHQSIGEAQNRFKFDDFAKIKDSKLKLRKYDKAEIPDGVLKLQKAIDSSMPSIRIEQLLMEVDKETNFSKHFMPVQQHHSRPNNYYQTLLAALISQATNLGVVGGLYGVALGKVFFGESMFSRETDASKVALRYLCARLLEKGYHLIDCQVASDHLFSLGAEEIPRKEFIKLVNQTLQIAAFEQKWD